MAQTKLNQTQLNDYSLSSSMARQAIMNGNFDIWQRGVSVNAASGAWCSDRWRYSLTLDGATVPTRTGTREIITSGALPNSFYCNRLTVDGAGSGFGTGTHYRIVQKIEYGTRNLCGLNKTVTVSFWAKSDIASKKIGIYLIQNYGTTGSPSAEEDIVGEIFDLTSSWQKFTHTFTTNTLVGKTFGTGNNDNLSLQIGHAWGSAAAALYGGSTEEDFGGSGYIDIAQIQLCAGDVALPFEPKTWDGELADCQRYYQDSNYDINRTNMTNNFHRGIYVSSGNLVCFNWARPMRISPTVVIYNSTTANQVQEFVSGTLRTVTGTVHNENSLGTVQATSAAQTSVFHYTADAEL